MFTIYKNGKIWDHAIIRTNSKEIALKTYLRANMIENNGEFTCGRGEREEELTFYEACRRI